MSSKKAVLPFTLLYSINLTELLVCGPILNNALIIIIIIILMDKAENYLMDKVLELWRQFLNLAIQKK